MKRDPAACSDMTQLRAEIDRVDRDLVALLSERRFYIERAAELKQGNGWPARIDARVEEVVARARAEAARHDLDADLVERLWRQLVDWSIDLEEARLGRDDGAARG